MTTEGTTPDSPPPINEAEETDVDALADDPDAEGSVVLGGERYYPFGDLNDRARFLQGVLAGSTEMKRQALEAIGANATLQLMEQDVGELPDERLDYVLLAVFSQQVEQIGETRGAHGRLRRGILGVPHYREVDDVFHADVGFQIAASLEARKVLTTPLYVDAFRSVPRSRFLLSGLEWTAYLDAPLPIGSRQTNSQPSTVAKMIETLKPNPGEKILDVGTGSAWTTAILRHIAGPEGRVIGTEIRPELVTLGTNNLNNCPGNGSAEIRQAKEGVLGVPDEGPFDCILVSAGQGTEIPAQLMQQLKVGGTMVIPLRGELLQCTKLTKDDYEIESYDGYTFVPLIEQGEPLVEKPRVYVAGYASPTFADCLRRLGYDAEWRPRQQTSDLQTAQDRVLQMVFEAYESDVTVIIDDGLGRMERRVLLGAAIGAVVAGQEKQIYLVGKSAHRSEFTQLPYVRTFESPEDLLGYLREQ